MFARGLSLRRAYHIFCSQTSASQRNLTGPFLLPQASIVFTFFERIVCFPITVTLLAHFTWENRHMSCLTELYKAGSSYATGCTKKCLFENSMVPNFEVPVFEGKLIFLKILQTSIRHLGKVSIKHGRSSGGVRATPERL